MGSINTDVELFCLTHDNSNAPVVDKAHNGDTSFALRSKVCLQGLQRQLNQANVEHAAVMSQLRALHSAALEEVRCLRQQQSRI